MNRKEKINEKGIPYGSRQKMPLWYSVIWSSRGVSAGIAVIMMMQIAYYCTDILGLNATVVGTLFLISKVIDAFTDLGFGLILDRTHTRFGKARPYEVFIVLEWVFMIFMYNVPKFGAVGQYIWIFIMYVLINAVCATALGGIDSVYLARVFTTQSNQITAMAVNGFVVMLVSIAFNIVFPRWLATEGTTREGWAALTVPMGILLALIGILRFIFCKEVIKDTGADADKRERSSLSLVESMRLVGKNRCLLIIVALMLLTFWVNNMSTAATYYFKYIVGDISLQGTVAITMLIVIPALAIFPALSKKFGTTRLLQVCTLIGIIGITIRTIGGTRLATLILGGILGGIGTLPISLMINTYLIDCMDYGEWKTGTRIEGMIASIANFASKVGNGIAFGAVGLVMGVAGYDGLAKTQSAAVSAGIVFLYNILPLILFLVMFVLTLFYNVDSIRPQMEAELKGRNEGI